MAVNSGWGNRRSVFFRVQRVKDLSNIRADASRGDTRNDLTTVVAQLHMTPGAIFYVVVDDENKLHVIFYQDVQMQKMFAAFPEVLFVDAMYKLNKLRMPVYVLIVENDNGHSKIVAFWLATSEDRMSIKQMADLVVSHNPCPSQVHVIMETKDFSKREVFAQTFPQATMLISHFADIPPRDHYGEAKYNEWREDPCSRTAYQVGICAY